MITIENIAWWVVSNAVFATLLALLAWCVARRTSRPSLAYACWALVLLKLVTPPIWSIPVRFASVAVPSSHLHAVRTAAFGRTDHSGGTDRASEHRIEGSPIEGLVEIWIVLPADGAAGDSAAPAPAAADSELGSAFAADRGRDENTFSTSSALAQQDSGVSGHESPDTARAGSPAALLPGTFPTGRALLRWLGVFWLTGCVLIVVGLVGRSVRFSRLLRAAPAAPNALRREVAMLARSLGLRRPPQVRLVDARISPMIWFWAWRPVLILPTKLIAALTPDQRTTLIAHELSHLRRKDHWMRMLELAATTLYWWHPIAWWARAQLRQVEEARCDAWVVQRFPQLKRAYLEAILDVIDFLADAFPPMPALASGFGRAAVPLQRRLEMMVRRDPGRPLSWLSRLVVAALALAVLPWAVGLADDTSKSDHKNQERSTAKADGSVTDGAKADSIRAYVLRLAGLADDDDDDDDDDRDRKRRSRDARRRGDKDRPASDRKKKKGPPRRPHADARHDHHGDRHEHRHDDRHRDSAARGGGHDHDHDHGDHRHGRHEGDRHTNRENWTYRWHVDGKEVEMPKEVRERIERAMRQGGEARRRMMVVMGAGRDAGRVAHLTAATHHLRAAGLHDMAERVERELDEAKEKMERQGKGDGRRGPRVRVMEFGPGGPPTGRGPHRPEGEAHHGPGGPHGPPGPPRGGFGPPAELRAIIERRQKEIREEVEERMRDWMARRGKENRGGPEGGSGRRGPEGPRDELGRILRELQHQMRELRREVEELKEGRRR